MIRCTLTFLPLCLWGPGDSFSQDAKTLASNCSGMKHFTMHFRIFGDRSTSLNGRSTVSTA